MRMLLSCTAFAAAIGLVTATAQTATAQKKTATPAAKTAPATKGRSTASAPAAKPATAAVASKSGAAAAKSGAAAKATGATASAASKTTAHRTTTVAAVRRPTTTWRNRQMAPTADRYHEIQEALVARGYLHAEDATGRWDQNSIDALKRFQADQKIDATGKLNSLSLIALGLGPRYDSASAKADSPGGR